MSEQKLNPKCTFEHCKNEADVSVCVVATLTENGKPVRHVVALPFCLTCYLEHFHLHMAYPITEHGYAYLKGAMNRGG